MVMLTKEIMPIEAIMDQDTRTEVLGTVAPTGDARPQEGRAVVTGLIPVTPHRTGGVFRGALAQG